MKKHSLKCRTSFNSNKLIARTLILFICLGVFYSCKKDGTNSKIDNAPTTKELAKGDSINNAGLVDNLGNVYLTQKYPPNTVNIPLAIFSFGADSLSCMGNTDQDGKIAGVTGYIFYNAADGIRYTYAKAADENTIILGTINPDNKADKFAVSIGTYNDTLVRTVGYDIDYTANTKEVLFDLVQTKAGEYTQPEGNLRVFDSRDAVVDNNKDNLVPQIQDLVLASFKCLPDYKISYTIGKLTQSYGADLERLNIDKGKLVNMLNIQQIAAAKFETLSQKITNIKATAKTSLTGKFDKIVSQFDILQRKLSSYKASLSYTIEKSSGDNQVVYYGDKLNDLVVKTTKADGSPIALSGTCMATSSTGNSLSIKVKTNADGLSTVHMGTVDPAIDNGTQKTLTVVFTFGNLFNKKSATFTITVKSKPQLSILADNTTNNQTAATGSAVLKPLKVQVLDANLKPVQNIKINWTENTAGITGTGLGAAQTVTDASGYTTNRWVLKGAAGTKHVAKATIVTGSSYIINVSSVNFNATSVKIDSTTLYTNAAKGSWEGDWSKPYDGQIDIYTLNSDGRGQRVFTGTAASLEQIPLNDGYNTVTWIVYKKDDDYYISIPYTGRNIAFGGKLSNYPHLEFTAHPVYGDDSITTKFKKID